MRHKNNIYYEIRSVGDVWFRNPKFSNGLCSSLDFKRITLKNVLKKTRKLVKQYNSDMIITRVCRKHGKYGFWYDQGEIDVKIPDR